jgi:hypothetical protein
MAAPEISDFTENANSEGAPAQDGNLLVVLLPLPSSACSNED